MLQTGKHQHRGTFSAEKAAASFIPFHTQEKLRQPEPSPTKRSSTYPGRPSPRPATALCLQEQQSSACSPLPISLHPTAGNPTCSDAAPELSCPHLRLTR